MYASRSQLCLNSSVKSLTGAVQAAACDKLVKGHDCDFWRYHAMEARVQHLANIADIEDLAHVGMAKRVCAPIAAINAAACLPATLVTTLCMHAWLAPAGA